MNYGYLENEEAMQFGLFSKIVAGLKTQETASMLELGCATAFYSARFNELMF
jgi:hypothetical protein